MLILSATEGVIGNNISSPLFLNGNKPEGASRLRGSTTVHLDGGARRLKTTGRALLKGCLDQLVAIPSVNNIYP